MKYDLGKKYKLTRDIIIKSPIGKGEIIFPKDIKIELGGLTCHSITNIISQIWVRLPVTPITGVDEANYINFQINLEDIK